jgi:predicted permease
MRALDDLYRDVRYALRSLRRMPGFSLVAILSFGLAIGANAAIFSLLNALVFRDLPVADPARLVSASTRTALQGERPLTLPMFLELSARQRVFSGTIAATGNQVITIADGERTLSALLWAASGNVFDELGLRPAAGRLLRESDTSLQPLTGDAVAVLGHSFWQRHFGGDPSVVGQIVRIERAMFTIVGVAPSGFTGFSIVTEPDITIPLGAMARMNARPGAPLAASQPRTVRFVGRLRPGVTLEQARAALMAAWPAAREASLPAGLTGDRRRDFVATELIVASAAKGLDTSLRAQYAQPLTILLAVAALVLLIACTNVAGLLLSRTSARRQEVGLRLALGAGRSRIARQLMTEGVLLSLAGATVGVGLAFWAGSQIAEIVFAESLVPVVFDGRPDLRVVALTTLVGAVAGMVCSVLPAWRGASGTAADALRARGRTFTGSGRSAQLVTCAQVALSLVLLTTAGVLLRSLQELRALDTGIERTDRVVVAYPAPAQPGSYDGIDNDTYYRQVLERLEAVPGVQRASISLLKPGTGGGFRDAVSREDAAVSTGVAATRSPVSPGFFEVLGVRVLEGRDFGWQDHSRGARVTVISRSLARRLFGAAGAVGKRVRIGLDESAAALDVIGVVEDARVYDMRSDDALAAYTAALQDPAASFKCFVIRGGDVAAADITRAVTALGHERMGSVVSLRFITDQSLLLERLAAILSRGFGALVLLLAGVGLFGLLAQRVAQRRKEIGIRMAAGADRRRILFEVVRRGLAVFAAGLAVGGLLSLWTVQLVEPLLFGVAPDDPVTLATAAGALFAAAIVASIVPALHAARVDPITALRCD